MTQANTPVTQLCLLLVLLCAATACGDDGGTEEESCGAGTPILTSGLVGDVATTYKSAEIQGKLTGDTLLMSLGEIEYTPQGGSTETRGRVLEFVSLGSTLSILDTVSTQLSDGPVEFTVVPFDSDTACSVESGTICARFGLDSDGDAALGDDDTVIHHGKGGTVTFTNVSATIIEAEWAVSFGENVKKAFDESSGDVEGCLSAEYSVPSGETRTLSPR